MNKSSLEKIKYFYIYLLFIFQYFIKNSQINNNYEDLIVYRASQFTEEDSEVYKLKNNLNINFIFK